MLPVPVCELVPIEPEPVVPVCEPLVPIEPEPVVPVCELVPIEPELVLLPVWELAQFGSLAVALVQFVFVLVPCVVLWLPVSPVWPEPVVAVLPVGELPCCASCAISVPTESTSESAMIVFFIPVLLRRGCRRPKPWEIRVCGGAHHARTIG